MHPAASGPSGRRTMPYGARHRSNQLRSTSYSAGVTGENYLRGPRAHAASIRKAGGSMRVDPHSGHEPGRVRRPRRTKAYPQAMQLAGSMTSRSPRARMDRSRCSRCPATSFSRMETRSDSSRDVAAPRSNSSRIASRIVCVRSTSRACTPPGTCQLAGPSHDERVVVGGGGIPSHVAPGVRPC